MDSDTNLDPRSVDANEGGSTVWTVITERLLQYRLRSVLSALGIAVGAATIVFVTSLVQSTASEASAGLARLGQNRLFVASAPQVLGAAVRRTVLTLDDARDLRRHVPNLDFISPVVTLSATMVACGRRYPIHVRAVSPEHLALEDQRLVSGRYIAAVDIEHGSSVAVIGHSLWRRESCLQRPLSFVQIGPHSFQIVGLLDRKGQRWGEDLDETVHIPFATAERRYGRAGTPVSLIVGVRDGGDVTEAASSIRRVLRRRHGGRAADDQIMVRSQTDVLDETAGLANRVASLTGLLLSVALVIAGIGVVNSVMTSVIERTSEIGLRRAVGATRRRVAQQFLLESLLISTTGAVLGILGGAAAAAAASRALELPVSIDTRMAGVSIIFAIALGIVCGLWPAYRAANLTPTDALRHE